MKQITFALKLKTLKKMKKIFTLFLLFIGLNVSAQTDTTSYTSADYAQLESRLKQVEESTSKWDKLRSKLPAMSGYIELAYDDYDQNALSNADVSSFYIKRVRMSFKGQIVENLSYALQIELASPKIVDAIIAYQPLNQFGIKVGQYKIPFSYENTDCSPTKMEFIEFPLGLRLLSGFSTTLYNTASSVGDQGATIYGGFFPKDGYNLLSYDLGVFNGNGSNTTDVNTSKGVAARLRFRPVENLHILASAYRSEDNLTYDHRFIYSFGAHFTTGILVLRSEYFGGVSDYPYYFDSFEHSDDANMKSSSWYALAGVNIIPSLMLAARYDTFTYDTANDENRQDNYTVGVNYTPIKNLRLSINYTHEEYKYVDYSPKNVVSAVVFGMF